MGGNLPWWALAPTSETEVTITQLDAFLSYLADCGVSMTERTRQESFAITKHWTSTFATSSHERVEMYGSRAVAEWLATSEDDLVLLFLSSRITAFPISQNTRPCSAYAYRGPVVDLSPYHDLEFAVFPERLNWTLIHTHEDGASGGPYFIRVAPDFPPGDESAGTHPHLR